MALNVNVGCGSRFHPDWLNLDLHAHAPGVTACDLTNGIPVGDGGADVVYAAAVLEHIHPSDVSGFLAECRRALKKGGFIRLAVPDLEQQARVYLETLDRLQKRDITAAADREWMVLELLDQSVREHSGGRMLQFLMQPEISNREFVLNRIGLEGADLIDEVSKWKNLSPVPPKPGLFQMVPFGRLGRSILKYLLRTKDLENDFKALELGRFRLKSGEIHQWAYDQHSLREILIASGFHEAKKYAHGESRIPEWQKFHLELNPEGLVEKPDLLVMEAIK